MLESWRTKHSRILDSGGYTLCGYSFILRIDAGEERHHICRVMSMSVSMYMDVPANFQCNMMQSSLLSSGIGTVIVVVIIIIITEYILRFIIASILAVRTALARLFLPHRSIISSYIYFPMYMIIIYIAGGTVRYRLFGSLLLLSLSCPCRHLALWEQQAFL